MKKNNPRVVYSTNPNYDYDDNDDIVETLSKNQQKLYVSHDSKQRKGKIVTLIENFIGSSDDLKDLCKLIKSKCGVGGSAKNDSIIIQGKLKDKVALLLENEGYMVIKKGG
jgi:translation initiation factor 1